MGPLSFKVRWLLAAACVLLFYFAWPRPILSGHDPSSALIPQWECTKLSRMCGCVHASKQRGGASPNVTYDLVRAGMTCPVGRARMAHRRVTVLLDHKTWLWPEFPVGEYACPRSTCVVSREQPDDTASTSHLPPSVDAFVTSVPGGKGRPHSRAGQRTVALAVESPVRYPFAVDDTWLRGQGITDVVRPAIWNKGTLHKSAFPTWPMTYSNADWEQYRRPPLPVDKKIPGIASFITNCDQETRTRRLDALGALKAGGVPVYSFGKCRTTHSVADLFPECAANQTDTVNGHRSPHFDFVKMCVLRHFMFTAAFENDVAEDYVSEKLYHALLAGSLPVYAGAPNVASYLPAPEAAVVMSDFSDAGIAHTVAEVKGLMTDRARYEQAFRWKAGPPAPHMRAVLAHSYATLPCLLCDDIAR